MTEYLWDSTRGIFANRVKHNDSLSQKIGQTSFYPMQGGSASVAQVRLLVEFNWVACAAILSDRA
jgi:neutral trehalase